MCLKDLMEGLNSLPCLKSKIATFNILEITREQEM